MSNKNKAQQPQQHHHHHHHHHQQQHLHPGASHVIGKQVEQQVPPQYQPPPQPTVGILKNHPNFGTVNGLPTSLTPTAVGLAPNALNHQQQQQQSQALRTAAAAAAAAAAIAARDAHGKYPASIDNRTSLIPQNNNNNSSSSSSSSSSNNNNNNNGNSNNKNSKSPSQGYASTKLTSGQYLPPNGQYPTAVVPITIPRQRITDDELLRLGPVEMLKFVRKTESDIARVAAEQNRQIQSLLSELRSLKEANQRLSDDNQELRDLCCFLDDDRQKGRKLAREWQRFGRYTASVMRQEVSAYQNKLRQLDNKQQELIKDNLELKELCLYLDEERGGGGGGGGGGQRDDGDGSSSSTNAEETAPSRSSRHTSMFNDQTMQYVRSLEQRVKQLEEDKSALQARAQTWETQPGEIWENPPDSPSDSANLGGRPEAVVRALQVLEVREQLEREAGHDGEKALVREMCNVVWRKLEEGPQTRR